MAVAARLAKIDHSPIEPLFALFDHALRAAGDLAMFGQLADATIVPAPKQRNSKVEKQVLREGRIPDGWAKKPAKLRQKDRDARGTVKSDAESVA